MTYKTKEVAAIFGVTPAAVTYWIREGMIPAEKVSSFGAGRNKLVDKDFIDQAKIKLDNKEKPFFREVKKNAK